MNIKIMDIIHHRPKAIIVVEIQNLIMNTGYYITY